jgi:hypothetical protein
MTPRGLYRLKVIGEIHSQVTETVFHFRTKDSSTFTTYQSEMNALLTDFKAVVMPKLHVFANQEWAVKSILMVSLIPSPGVLIEDRQPGGGGFQVGHSLPSYCAGLLTIRTGLSGRSGHGRIYVPGVPEDFSSNSRLDGTSLGFLQDIGNALLTRYGASGTYNSNQYGVFSRVLGVTRQAGPPPRLVYSMNGFMLASTAIARPEIATQRKRKLGRGQ